MYGHAQPQMMPYTPFPPLITPPAQTGGGNTIIIDTNSRALQSSGFMEDEMDAQNGMPVMGRSNRRITPRARPMSPRREPASFGSGGGAPAPGTKFVINKIG